MSGGVDSSVAALLLTKQGYEVVGCHMLCWDGCDSQNDRRDATRVSAKLGIPFITFDFRKEYREKVFEYMVREYAAGRTPNPDVTCNKEIKFGIFLERALELGADYVATGHYVRKIGDRLFEAKDKNKDQSYFLWALTREQLQRSLFPIGDYLKEEVREMARRAELATAHKKDSQGLCFVGKVDFQDFMRKLLPRREGLVKNSQGEILGKHDGAHFFTPGQRHGLQLGGFSAPLYVAEKDVLTNTLVVAEGRDNPILYKKEIEVGNLNLLRELPEKIEARIRYRQPRQAALVYKPEAANYKLIFDSPQWGVASGQSAAFYLPADLSAKASAAAGASAKAGEGEELVGGGVIQ